MEEITKEEIKKIMETPGKGKGVTLRCIADYVQEKKGGKGVKLLEKEMGNLGYPLEFAKIRNLEWYPVGLRVVAFLVAKKVFGWGNKEIKDLGRMAVKFSFMVKLIMNYFVSPRKVFYLAPSHWEKHYTIGSIETAEWDEKEKTGILRQKDFKLHPAFCVFLSGYFEQMGRLAGAKNATCIETKCIHKGDSYHEFVIRWE